MEIGQFQTAGFAIVRDVLGADQADVLIRETSFSEIGATHSRQGRAFGNRQLLDQPAIAELARSTAVTTLVRSLLPDAFAVRAILFDKVPGANWKVGWHQDWTIAVKQKCDVEGYGPWSMKDGQPHVQAPSPVLERMLAVRLHLDNCNAENGPLRVKPGTHAYGRVPKEEARMRSESIEEVALTCNKGDAILMSPLLMHSSSSATTPEHRRVIHIEYANCELEPPLEWARRIA